MSAYLSTREVARELRVRDSKVVAWIEAGRLRAINTSTTGRPRWRVHRDWINAMADAPVTPPRQRRRSSLPPVPRLVG